MSARSGDIKYDLKTIKNRLKWEKIISHFKRLCFSNFAVGYKELSEYLSNIIGKKFKLPQKALEPYEIIERLEKKSDYTLLNIETEQDSYSLFVCKQKDKKRILQLARMLDFAIVPF